MMAKHGKYGDKNRGQRRGRIQVNNNDTMAFYIISYVILYLVSLGMIWGSLKCLGCWVYAERLCKLGKNDAYGD